MNQKEKPLDSQQDAIEESPRLPKQMPIRGLRMKSKGHLSIDMDSEIADIQSVVTSLIKILSEAVPGKSKLTVELTTSIGTSKEAESGANVYVFNIGGQVTGNTSGEMKIVLEMPINPTKSKIDHK